MALPWDSATPYSPNALVLYNGFVYFRSFFPETPTQGTPPDTEMSVDTYGNDVRTWTLNGGSAQPYFVTNYFRLIAPTYITTQLEPEFEYSGGINFNYGAYGPSGDYDSGSTVEYDQEIDDHPVCPVDKCGIALQQLQEYALFCSVYYTNNFNPTTPRVYLAWVLFNHPLYFRRTITSMVRIRKTEAPDSGPIVVSYINTTYDVTPTDLNFVTSNYSSTIFTSTNSSFTFTVPADTANDSYEVVEALVSDVSSND